MPDIAVAYSGDSGLGVTLRADKYANGRSCLDDLVRRVERFYVQHISDVSLVKQEDRSDSVSYRIISVKYGNIGQVRIVPRGVRSRSEKVNHNEDYTIRDGTRYFEGYSVFLNYLVELRNAKGESMNHANPKIRDGLVAFLNDNRF